MKWKSTENKIPIVIAQPLASFGCGGVCKKSKYRISPTS